jgi:hypothetical protein
VTGLLSAPFIINNFVSAQIAEGVLPNWYVDSGIVKRLLISARLQAVGLRHGMTCHLGEGLN